MGTDEDEDEDADEDDVMMKMEMKMKMPPLYCARVHVCLFTNRAAEA